MIKIKTKNIITSAVIIAASLLLVKEAQADLKGNIRYIRTEDSRNSFGSYVEAQGSYSLPLGIKAFSFIDAYNSNGNKGEGYFGRTTLRREIKNPVISKTQLLYANELFRRLGTGIAAKVPGLPEGTFIELSFLPIWFNNNGERIEDLAELQYGFNAKLPHGFNLSGFGQWNVAKKGFPWMYGELKLGKKIHGLNLAYDSALITDGDKIPDLENRVSLGVDF